uniref:Uncharacterized protein n=1 Tax=Romanomermis culicivorax TaxID=13658 RepID=A0A915KXN7_ROMCU
MSINYVSPLYYIICKLVIDVGHIGKAKARVHRRQQSKNDEKRKEIDEEEKRKRCNDKLIVIKKLISHASVTFSFLLIFCYFGNPDSLRLSTFCILCTLGTTTWG